MRVTLALLWSRVAPTTLRYSNLPERYVKRAMEEGFVEWRTPDAPQFLPREVKKRRFYFGMHRCWSNEFRMANMQRQPRVFLRPVEHWNYFCGDVVQVLVGVDRGKQGVVAQLIEERNWVVVLGLNCRYRTVGRTADYPGTMMPHEMPLLIDEEVSLVDPADNKPCQVEWRFTESGERVRVSTRTGRIVPLPERAEETYDYKTPDTYKESPKDTDSKTLAEVTFKPRLVTFEMDVAESCGVQLEAATRRQSYWY